MALRETVHEPWPSGMLLRLDRPGVVPPSFTPAVVFIALSVAVETSDPLAWKVEVDLPDPSSLMYSMVHMMSSR